MQAAIEAVAEVGNPTVVATLTVVAALLPMLFVSGLMGPYMAPIPANASAAMLFSFFVAMVVAPWLMLKLARRAAASRGRRSGIEHDEGTARPPLSRGGDAADQPALVAPGCSCCWSAAPPSPPAALFYTETVTVKLLPFDNKSELAVVADLPEGASLETTERVLFAAAARQRGAAGGHLDRGLRRHGAPFNFNGLVRHYYLRQSPELGDLHIDLKPKDERARSSHAMALDLRRRLAALTLPEGTVLKVVEVPPGPPVLATLLAEVYGPDAAMRRATAEELKRVFRSVPFIVDVDDSYGHPRPRLRIAIDQDELEYLRRRAERRVRHGAGVVRRRAGRLLLPRRGPRIRSASWSACRSAT